MYTISELAKHLGVSRQWAFVLVKTGKVAGKRIGRCTWIVYDLPKKKAKK